MTFSMPAHGLSFEGKMPRVLVFDVDGTLIDTLPPMRQALNEVLIDHHRAPWAEHAVRERLSLGLDGLLAHALRADGPVPGAAAEAAARTALLERYADLAPQLARSYPGADAVLRQARDAGYRLAVCSNASGRVLQGLFETLGWLDLFETWVHADNALALKPSGLPLQQALAALSASAKEAWLIGDSALDAVCAEAVGCGFVWFSAGYGSARPPSAIVQVDRLADLTTLLRHHAA